MVFNWFRRQYEESSDKTPKPTPEPEKEQVKDASSSQPQKSTEQSTQSTEEYLNWAKSAYKNIQKQKKTESQELQTTDTETDEKSETKPVKTETEVEPTIPEAQPVAEDITKVELRETEPAEIKKVESDPTLEETTPVETQPTETEIKVDTATTVEQTVPENQESEQLPFWAKAQAERQARVERLKETAIEEPELETAQTKIGETEPEVEIDPMILDEAFLWSAEILAAQGRRPDRVSIEEISWLKKLRRGLDRTRRNLLNQLRAIVGQGPLNQDAVMEIESLLLQADVGIKATDYIIETLQEKLRQEVLPPEEAIAYLKKILREILDKPFQDAGVTTPAYNLTFVPEKDTLNIWIMTGVNGAGKTTTIGKIAHLAAKSDYRCLIAGADTFRAAAVEQLKIWGERSGIEVIANPGKNTDPAAVVFDGIVAAQARNTELLIVDTAGRLQNKKNLMDELSKIRRIIDKKAPDAVVESLLVLDATLGQNGLRQAEVFSKAAKLSGVVLTKLDGTAKGGVALAVVKELGLPIRFIGVGESIEDLRPFSSYEFVEALLGG
ncbi:MAG: signal recognition particle-docking protein FtsY [Microcoleaceae cyanobacterium]